MKPTACPYPFPVLWHRTMAQVMADEARQSWRDDRREKRRARSGLTVRKHGEFQPNGYGKQTGKAAK